MFERDWEKNLTLLDTFILEKDIGWILKEEGI
jgi:hypothetical protein